MSLATLNQRDSMNIKKETIDAHQRQIIQIYHDYELTCIRGLKNENELNGQNIMTWHNDAVQPYREGNNFDFFKDESDIKNVSDKILYFTANTYLYRPFINDPIAEKFEIKEGKFVYPNIQNLYAKKI